MNIAYKDLSDPHIVELILQDGNEEAALYLLYNRYEKDLRFLSMRYYDSLEYLDELIAELYLKFKGKDGDWAPLKSFQWRSSFRTWFSSVASHLFLEKKNELIGLTEKAVSIDNLDKNPEYLLPSESIEENKNLVVLMEAINRLDEDYKFILIKDIEGYNAIEISKMLTEKRRLEGRLKVR
jgi:RNA polymerase sigma factor (sigma-70 family)